MIKTPLSTAIGGVFWTPGATILGSASKTLNQLIKSLFASNEQGFAYDPNDLTTLYQDAAGTIPVTGAGQPVGLIKDKSGRNNHAYQTTSASRPILRKNAATGAYYLEFDGSDDFLQTSNIDFTATDKVSLFAGVRKLSDAATGMVVELSSSANVNDGSFHLYQTTGSRFQFASRGTVAVSAPLVVNNAPLSTVIDGFGDISADTTELRVNAVNKNQVSTEQGTGNYGNYPLYIGRRGGTSVPFNGHIYGLIGIGKLTSENETRALEKTIAKNIGVTLNV